MKPANAISQPNVVDLRVVSNDAAEPSRVVPGQPDMWIFVLFESFIFTGYFATYIIRRTQSPDLFLESQSELSLRTGVFNTLVLLASSWSVARSVQAARERAFPAALRSASLTAAFGFAFMVSKVLEWAREIGKGYGFTASEFFSFYYFLTAIHFIHLLIGFIAVGVIVHQLRRPTSCSQELVETCATYWHTVDYLWVVIFALLYVMR
jgi:nitric oxide reductase NorE protein